MMTAATDSSFGALKQVDAGLLSVDVPDAELAERLAAYQPPPPLTGGVLGRYSRLVGSASDGAVLG